MKFLVELDYPQIGMSMSGEASRTFIEDVIFPSLGRAEQLVKEGYILAGGPVAGRIAFRFIVDAESALQLDQLIFSIPLWAVAETRVTPLIEFNDRRRDVQALLQLKTPLGLTNDSVAAAAPP